MELGLRDKIALVTGAGSGIGQAIALSLASEGTRLVATDVREETAVATATAAMACGVDALGLSLDVTNYGQAQAVVQQAVQRFGRVDILVNCAGAWRVNLFVDSQPEDWTFEVHTCFMGWCHTSADDAIDGVMPAVKRHHVLLIQLGTPKPAANMRGHGLIGGVLATCPRIHDGTGHHPWVTVKVLQDALPGGIVRNVGNFSNA